MTELTSKVSSYKKRSALSIDWRRNWKLYVMIIPVLLFYLLFCYKPIYGALIAFQNFIPSKGMAGSEWIGFANFEEFFQSRYFMRSLINTLRISITSILFGFPAPIILALLINEIKNKRFAKVTQTITYLPHFTSLVVMCSIITVFVNGDGVVNVIMSFAGYPKENMLNNPSLFVPIYVISDIWQGVGWGSIIYLAAIAGIDQALYEAAHIDGAGRIRQTIHITIPGIMGTVITLFILRLGQLMNVGFEKVILLYNPITYETADIISTYVYRAGLMDQDYGYSAAVGLFNSLVNFILVYCANIMSRKYAGAGLW